MGPKLVTNLFRTSAPREINGTQTRDRFISHERSERASLGLRIMTNIFTSSTGVVRSKAAFQFSMKVSLRVLTLTLTPTSSVGPDTCDRFLSNELSESCQSTVSFSFTDNSLDTYVTCGTQYS
jgi:hypothetical protein